MKTIHRYNIKIGAVTVLELPKDSEILSAGVKFGIINIWAEVDIKKELMKRSFLVVGTGWGSPNENKKFIGTCIINDGNEVYHVYELETK